MCHQRIWEWQWNFTISNSDDTKTNRLESNKNKWWRKDSNTEKYTILIMKPIFLKHWSVMAAGYLFRDSTRSWIPRFNTNEQLTETSSEEKIAIYVIVTLWLHAWNSPGSQTTMSSIPCTVLWAKKRTWYVDQFTGAKSNFRAEIIYCCSGPLHPIWVVSETIYITGKSSRIYWYTLASTNELGWLLSHVFYNRL